MNNGIVAYSSFEEQKTVEFCEKLSQEQISAVLKQALSLQVSQSWQVTDLFMVPKYREGSWGGPKGILKLLMLRWHACHSDWMFLEGEKNKSGVGRFAILDYYSGLYGSIVSF